MGLEEPVSCICCFWSRDQRIVRNTGITSTSRETPSSDVSCQMLAFPKHMALSDNRERHTAVLLNGISMELA